MHTVWSMHSVLHHFAAQDVVLLTCVFFIYSLEVYNYLSHINRFLVMHQCIKIHQNICHSQTKKKSKHFWRWLSTLPRYAPLSSKNWKRNCAQRVDVQLFI